MLVQYTTISRSLGAHRLYSSRGDGHTREQKVQGNILRNGMHHIDHKKTILQHGAKAVQQDILRNKSLQLNHPNV